MINRLRRHISQRRCDKNHARTPLSQSALAALLVSLCFGWQGGAFGAASPVTVIDSAGRSVSLAAPAQRIVALAPHIVENVFSAGAGGQLVGAVSYSNYPPQASQIPVVGGFHSFSLEAIIALQPDLVLMWASGNGDNDLATLEKLGIAVYVNEPKKLEDIAITIKNIGVLSGHAVSAAATANLYLQKLAEIRRQYSQLQPLSVFYQVWNQPLYTINGEHMISELIELCGGRNIFADTRVLAPKVSLEAVIQRNPEVIIASGMDEARPEWLDEWQRFPQLQAVANHNLYFVPPDILQRHTIRLLQGAQGICQSLQQARGKLAAKAQAEAAGQP